MTLPGTAPWPADVAARYRAAGFRTGKRLDRVASRHTAATPEAIAMADDTERLTYAEFEHRLSHMTDGLISLGILPRDRVLPQRPNKVSFLVTALALMRTDAIAIYLLPAHRHSEVNAIADQVDPVAYIGPPVNENFDDRPMAADLAERRKSALNPLRVIIDDGTLEGQLDLAEVLNVGRGRECRDGVPADTDNAAFLQLSGGTTRTPRLIPRTHDDYLYSVRQSVKVRGLDASAVMRPVLPAAHNFPLSSPGFLGVLLAGGRVVLGFSPAADAAFPISEREAITTVPLVPPLALAWVRAAAATTSDLAGLRTIQVGEAKFLPESARRIHTGLGAKLQQVFGMAEGLVCHTLDTDEDETVSTIRSHYQAEQHNATAFTSEGFYRTRDIVRRLPGGYLSVEGRSKDQINREDEKNSAEEVENHLFTHPLVHDAAIATVPDPYQGERSCAVIVLDGEPPARRDIHQLIRDRDVAAHKVPDRIEFVTAFPHHRGGEKQQDPTSPNAGRATATATPATFHRRRTYYTPGILHQTQEFHHEPKAPPNHQLSLARHQRPSTCFTGLGCRNRSFGIADP